MICSEKGLRIFQDVSVDFVMPITLEYVIKKAFLEIEALAGACSVCSKSLIVWLLQFTFSLPSKLINLASAVSHIVIHPGVASFPASCHQSV